METAINRAGYLRESYHYFHLKDTAGQELDFHFHEFDKLIILISGKVDYRVESSSYELHPWDVLLVGHHGSKYSTGTTLLESVTPEVGVISVGDNSYGHPTEEALLRLTDAGMTVYRTDMQGNILITVD